MSSLAYECSHGSVDKDHGLPLAGCEVPGYPGRCRSCLKKKKRPAWRPRLRLCPKASGSYWYVLWTCDYAELELGSAILTVHPTGVPFMIRNSQAAKDAHAFAARLNQQRGMAF